MPLISTLTNGYKSLCLFKYFPVDFQNLLEVVSESSERERKINRPKMATKRCELLDSSI